MGKILRVVAVICLLASTCLSQGHEKERLVPKGYELYSWQGAERDWEFCVLFNTDSEKSVKQVFDKRTTLKGVDRLKHRLSELPEGASVFWLNRIPLGTRPKAKGSEGLAYPPQSVIDEIRQYAETRKIKVEVLPSEESGGKPPKS
jgi:hypothetical protein